MCVSNQSARNHVRLKARFSPRLAADRSFCCKAISPLSTQATKETPRAQISKIANEVHSWCETSFHVTARAKASGRHQNCLRSKWHLLALDLWQIAFSVRNDKTEKKVADQSGADGHTLWDLTMRGRGRRWSKLMPWVRGKMKTNCCQPWKC